MNKRNFSIRIYAVYVGHDCSVKVKEYPARYDEDNPENMFYEDRTYNTYLHDMREILKNEKEFKDRYCEINHISSRNNKVKDEPGAIEYLNN